MTKDTLKTRVHFKQFPEDDTIAIFPELKGSQPWYCSSYQHIGQHGDCHIDLLDELPDATPEQYQSLKDELEGETYGYDLEIV